MIRSWRLRRANSAAIIRLFQSTAAWLARRQNEQRTSCNLAKLSATDFLAAIAGPRTAADPHQQNPRFPGERTILRGADHEDGDRARSPRAENPRGSRSVRQPSSAPTWLFAAAAPAHGARVHAIALPPGVRWRTPRSDEAPGDDGRPCANVGGYSHRGPIRSSPLAGSGRTNFTPRKSQSVRDTAHLADDSHARWPSRSPPVPIVEEKNRQETPLRSRRQVVARAQSRNQLSGIGSPSR